MIHFTFLTCSCAAVKVVLINLWLAEQVQLEEAFRNHSCSQQARSCYWFLMCSCNPRCLSMMSDLPPHPTQRSRTWSRHQSTATAGPQPAPGRASLATAPAARPPVSSPLRLWRTDFIPVCSHLFLRHSGLFGVRLNFENEYYWFCW